MCTISETKLTTTSSARQAVDEKPIWNWLFPNA